MTKKTPSYVQVLANSRTYRLRVKTNRGGKKYLAITELRSDGSEAPTRIVVFQSHMLAFHKGYLKAAKRLEPKLRAYDVEEIREDYPNAFKKWTPKDDRQLVTKFHDGLDLLELSQMFGRQPGGIRRRLQTLGLVARRCTAKSSGVLQRA
jgi:hypothetical protein